MSRSHLPGALRATRTRWASAGVAVALTAALTTTGLGAPSAQSATDTSCPAPYPEAQLTKGQPVTGLTVDGVNSATDPTQFTGTVLGVLKDGIAPGLDMIMARLTSPEIDRVGGIWQGMSGSPVYASDGRLVGAVAYGLSFGPSPVAGITPAADMEALLGQQATTTAAAPAARVAIPSRIARVVVAAGDATRGQVSGGMTQLRIPFVVSGLSTAKRMHQARKLLHLGNVRFMRGSAVGAGTTSASIVPGGNLAASLSYGDVTAAGIGTATAVCGSQVLGFGHPMLFSGPSTLTMHGAETLYVQEDSTFAPFKVANLTGPVGSIDQDRRAGIRGQVGPLPATSPVTSYVEAEGRSRTGTTLVSVQSLFPDLATTHVLADQDRVLDAVGPGSGQATWTIKGLREDGTPFHLRRSDLYASPYDISGTVGFTLYDTLYQLMNNSTETVTFSSVRTSSSLNLQYRHFQVAQLQVRQAGHWVTARRHRALSLRAGAVADLRVKLTSTEGVRWIPLRLAVPGRAAGQSGSLEVLGGNNFGGGFGGDGSSGGLDAVLHRLRTAPHHNEVIARLSMSLGKGHPVSRSAHGTAPAVVDGQLSFQVRGVR